MFHGLTAQQGNQIASYIRSLSVPNPGRPWNPPYQPGPGLDSQPVENWSAGAGLDAVLDSDAEMQQYLMPGGSMALFSAAAYLNPRETPLAMQYPDWNSWLPIIHPMDGFGTKFTSSGILNDFAAIRSELSQSYVPYNGFTGEADAYDRSIASGYQWLAHDGLAFFNVISPTHVSSWTPTLRQAYYSVGLWSMVKQWELNQDFGLEAMPSVPFGAKADIRGWYGTSAFDTAPNMQHVPAGPGLGNGTKTSSDYLSLIWYMVQFTLNDGQGTQVDHTPEDYGYVGAFVVNVCTGNVQIQCGMLSTDIALKALQEYTQAGALPTTQTGWNPTVTSPFGFVAFNSFPEWTGYSPSTIATIFTAYTQAWFNQASQYTPAQYYAGGWAEPGEDPAKDFYSGNFGGELWYILPRLRYAGVPASLTNQISAWAAKIWPKGNWALNNSAVCSSLGGAQTGCLAGGLTVF
jgi:hypothetical protein